MGFRVAVYNLSGQVEQQFEMQQGAVTLGRATDADVRLMSASVSRHHARLFVEQGSLRVVDLNSSNGVRINGVRIQGEAAVMTGSTVTLGDFSLRIDSSTAPHRMPIEPGGTEESLPAPGSTAAGPWSFESAPAADRDLLATHATSTGASPEPREVHPRIPRASDPEPPALVRFGDDTGGQRFPLTANEATIGRGVGNAVQLMHPSVSRVHAHLTRQGASWIISDADSANGTRVNGQRILAPVVVRGGDVVQVGDLFLAMTEGPGDVDFRRLTSQWVTNNARPQGRTFLVLGALLVVLVALAVVLAVAMKLRSGSLDRSTSTPAAVGAASQLTAEDLAGQGEWNQALAVLETETTADESLAARIRTEAAASDALDACREQMADARDVEASGANLPAREAWAAALTCLDEVGHDTDARVTAETVANEEAAPALIGLHRAGGAAALQARDFDEAVARFEAAHELWSARTALGEPPEELEAAIRRSHILGGDAAFSAENWNEAVLHYGTAHEIGVLDDARFARLTLARRRAN